jgi:WD40 repeat protein
MMNLVFPAPARRLRQRFLHASFLALVAAALASAANPQQQIRPRITVPDDCTAFAWAPDGRIAYATKHVMETRKLDIERDDIWLLEKDGSRHKIFAGEKMNQEGGAFSFVVTNLRWSPDGQKIVAELHVSQIPTTRGDEQDSFSLMMLDSEGHQLQIGPREYLLGRATDGAWLSDSKTLAYTTGAGRGSPLFTLHLLQPNAIKGNDIFIGHTFASVAWDPKHDAAVAVERTSALTTEARLTWLDLLHEDGRALATLDTYSGGLALSSDATKVAYFLTNDTIEVRDVAKPMNFARIHCDYGYILWSADGTKLLVKSGADRRAGELAWLTVPTLNSDQDPTGGDAQPAPKPFLTGVIFREAAISPDGKSVGVIDAGNRNLLVYDVSQ